MYQVFRKCIVPIIHDLSTVINGKKNFEFVGGFVKNHKHTSLCMLVLSVVNAEKIKLNKIEEEINQKCAKVEENLLKSEVMCFPEEEVEYTSAFAKKNEIMEKDSYVCDMYDESDGKLDFESKCPDPMSDPHETCLRSKMAEEIKKNLSWIRWTEFSPYAKDLIKSNKWDSIQDSVITVVSYNVLSHVLLEKHRYLYKRHDSRSLDWDIRSKILLEEFASFNADILCLQEVDSDILNSFYNYNLNKMGYHGVYKQRTNDKVDGCAIYFKLDKFSLVKQTTVEFYKESTHLLDRDNIGVILKLKLKSNPEIEMIVATTHLLYNPKRGDIKLAQTQLMLAEIEEMAYLRHNILTKQPEYLPIIFTGDMNYSPENGIYQLVTKSYLAYEGMSSEHILPGLRGYTLNKTLLPPRIGVTDSCQYASSLSNREGVNDISYSTGVLDHHLNLESVYSHVKGNFPEATTNQNTWVTVDYIFYSQLKDETSKLRMEGNLKFLSRVMLPNSREAEVYLKSIPNLACGSDHLPLIASFELVGNR